MNILHYFLGFPPYRSGGLTRYAYDLMTSQAQQGHKVSALWPGRMGLLNKAVKIQKGKQIQLVQSYELINPLPVPLDEGVACPERFMAPCQKQVYVRFLEKLRPDVIHIHTLMGLHTECLDAAKELGIQTVFTSHDYYGICPMVTLFRSNQVCCDDHGCEDCVACNMGGLSMKKILLMQSPLYRFAKNTPVVKALRKQHRGAFFAEQTLPEVPCTPETQALAAGYRALRQYYMDMLGKMSRVHFNSALTKSVYQKYLSLGDNRTVTITHKNIQDNRSLTREESPLLRITCLAPAKPFKGYGVLKEALDRLWDEGKRDFVLQMFGPVPETAAYMQVCEDGFSQQELPRIFSQTDVLVAPSVWYETFGFTVLEALSFGVPVIVTQHVGASDIVGDGGVVIPAGSAEALYQAIRDMTPEKLEAMGQHIRQALKIKTWAEFMDENESLYQF